MKELFSEVKDFCKKNKLSLLLVFGSHASEKTHSKSDIDIAVVSTSEVNRLKLICALEGIFKKNVDLVVITRKTDPLLMFEIFSNAKLLYEREEGVFENYQLLAWKKYLDTKKIREKESEYIKKYIGGLKSVSGCGEKKNKTTN
jgi:predicted nucleotidyltransferase